MEGEKTLCVQFPNLNEMQRVKSVLDVIKGDTTHVEFTHQCPAMACTADINPWNNPSRCQCPKYQTYNPKHGKCESGYLSGTLEFAVAIGGEAAQFLLTSYDGKKITEVSFADDELLQKARRFAERGAPVGIEGQYKTVYSVERGPWVLFEGTAIYWED